MTAASPACQHGGMRQDKVLVKTDFPVHACYKEKVREKFIHTESGQSFFLAQTKNSVH